MTTIRDIRPALRFLLLGDPAVNAAVGGTRVYAVLAPQGEVRPMVVYSRVSGLGVGNMGGASGLTMVRVQVDCWAQDMSVAANLANLVKSRLDGFSGEIFWDESSPGNSVVVQGIIYETERDRYDDVAIMFGNSRDYLIWYAEL